LPEIVQQPLRLRILDMKTDSRSLSEAHLAMSSRKPKGLLLYPPQLIVALRWRNSMDDGRVGNGYACVRIDISYATPGLPPDFQRRLFWAWPFAGGSGSMWVPRSPLVEVKHGLLPQLMW